MLHVQERVAIPRCAAGTADEPRAGLANVVGDGDLNATCELIESLLP